MFVPPIATWRGWLPLLLYHGVCLVAGTVLVPLVLWRALVDRDYRIGLLARMGRPPITPPGRRAVWIHGVSVGEVKGLGALIRLFEQSHPEFDIVISVTTPTGQALARARYGSHRVIHFPIDFGLFPGRAIDRVRPQCILLMEQEFWPMFLQAAARRQIPVAVVNGRISERSFRGYRLVRPLIPQFDWIWRFCVQNDTYCERLIALGVPTERIAVTGNMKYDGVAFGAPPEASAPLRSWLAAGDRQVLVCGSTHGREDEWLIEVVTAIDRQRERPVRLVLVPRHPERATEVAASLRQRSRHPVRWSECGDPLPVLGDADVILVDTIGHLEAFYGACDVAFVGGSLVPHGGQNMLEPAALGRAVVFGPHVANFRADVELLLAAGAAVQVAGVDTLKIALERMLADSAFREDLGERAMTLIRDNQGATARTLAILEPLLGATTDSALATVVP